MECGCGCIYYAAREDIESGSVKSCGHKFAASNRTIEEFFKIRWPILELKKVKTPEFKQLMLNNVDWSDLTPIIKNRSVLKQKEMDWLTI